MNIVLFSHLCGKDMITGAEKYVLTLARELTRWADCTLVVPQDGLLRQEAQRYGLRTHIQDYDNVWMMTEPGLDLIERLETRLQQREHGSIIALLQSLQPDLVIVNTCVNVLPAVAARQLGIPVAWFMNEKISEHAATLHAVEVIDRYADWIIGISETTLRPFRQKPPVASKLQLLMPTWNPEELHPDAWSTLREAKRWSLGIRPQEQVVGFISSGFTALKGTEHFAVMAAEVARRKPGTRFLMVGRATDPELFERCMRVLQASGHRSRVQHIQFDSNIESIVPAMDVVVVPSLIDEGFGLTAIEGMLFGKGVVTYRSGGLEEIMRATGNAEWIAEQGDTIGLIERVTQLLDAPLPQLGQASRSAVEAAFGIAAYRHRLGGLIGLFHSRQEVARAHRPQEAAAVAQASGLYVGEHDPSVYLVEYGQKRPFVSQETFRFYKYAWQDVRKVSDRALYGVPSGAPIRMDGGWAHRPPIMLARGSGKSVYLIANGRKHPFSSPAAVQQRGYAMSQVIELPEEELQQLPLGDAIFAERSAYRARRNRLRVRRIRLKQRGRRRKPRARHLKRLRLLGKRIRLRKGRRLRRVSGHSARLTSRSRRLTKRLVRSKAGHRRHRRRLGLRVRRKGTGRTARRR
ncbi:glycosyltransferase family 4 protein [Paenibacillus sp. YYML68]|uniref:glycosyltransferase family 4 protein n=1 Tax=Paenibacillus sp. YYML68 TaxID=2909250 RepID=UPI00249146DC|nr:glycosyltransferase family 4 protein [Paenibacillus sp. YYML68]